MVDAVTTQSARATFWVHSRDLDRLAGARHICYLVGGYSGQGNYGDIIQLATNLARFRSLKRDILPVPLFEARFRYIHQDICAKYPQLFRDACFLYYALGPESTERATLIGADADLVELTRPPSGFCQLLVYGGSNFIDRWGWGAHAMDEIEALQEWMGFDDQVSAVPRLLIIGQQVSSGFLSGPEGGRFKSLLGTAFAIGVRDRISFDAIAQTYGEMVSSKLFLSGDDAVPYIVENVLNSLDFNEESDAEIEFSDDEVVVNVQMSLEDYITNEPENLVDTVAFCIRELRRLHNRKISVNLVSGYEDRRSSETAHLEKLKTCFGDGDIEFNMVIGLSDLHQGFSQIRKADLTICCSYHTTLTSLVLGIPTLLLYANPYYAHKHIGLSLDFGIPSSMVFDVGQGHREHLSRTLEQIVSSPGWRRRLSARAVRGNTAMAVRNERAAVMLSEFLAAGRLAEFEERYPATKAALFDKTTVMPYVGLLAVGVLGAANYYWCQRRQRTMYSARTAAFVGHCHPAWWASPIAASLPIAYYAWRSRTTPTGHPPDVRSSGSPTGLSLPVALLAAAAEERLQEIGQLNEALSQKELVIADLAKVAEERLRAIEELDAALQQKEGVITDLARAAEERLRVIGQLDAALQQKEGVIADANALRREP